MEIGKATMNEPCRDSPIYNRWRPLEAALAAIGSQSEAILDCVEDEQVSGRPKPIDIDSLLVNIISPILSTSGRY